MSNWYSHEKKEPRIKSPRPNMPSENKYLRGMMVNYLGFRDLSPFIARANGWYPTYELDVHPRIVIPCTNTYDLPYFQARSMNNGEPRYKSPYASREDSIVLVYPKQSIRGTVIVEGPLDALAAASLNYLGIGLMGNDPPSQVVKHLVARLRGSEDHIYIVPDQDHPEMGARLLGELALYGCKDIEVRLPTKKDLADMSVLERKRLLT